MQGPHAGRDGGWRLSSFSETYNRVPRAMRWLIVFGVFILGYYLVLEPSLDSANQARDRADRLETALRRDRAMLASGGRRGGELDRSVTVYGLPRHPTEPDARPENLQRAVNKILMDQGISNATYSERSGVIPADKAVAVVGQAARLERFVLDVTFETTPERAMSILATLEQTPEVTAISRVKIDKSTNSRDRDSGGRIVRVNIAVESWIAGRAPGISTATAAAGGRL